MFKRKINLPDHSIMDLFFEKFEKLFDQQNRIIGIIEVMMENTPESTFPFSSSFYESEENIRNHYQTMQTVVTHEINLARKYLQEIKNLWPDGQSTTDQYELWLTDTLKWIEAVASTGIKSLELDLSDKIAVYKWEKDIQNYKKLAKKVDRELELICDSMEEFVKEAKVREHKLGLR